MRQRTVQDRVKDYFVATAGSLTATTPFFAAMETVPNELTLHLTPAITPEQSMDVRINFAKYMFLGLGWANKVGFDLSRKFFGITHESSKRAKGIHDGLYSGLYGLVVSIPLYRHAEATWTETLVGTACCTVLATAVGPLAGWSIDRSRDLAHIPHEHENERLRSYSSRVRTALGAAAVVASLGLTGLVYQATSGSKPPITAIPAEPTQ